MAGTDEAGFVERHVEKIVVALTFAALIYALVSWGLSSPRKIELSRSSYLDSHLKDRRAAYPPEAVDEALRERAEEMAKLIGAEPAAVQLVPSIAEWFHQSFRTPYDPLKVMALGIWDTPRLPVRMEDKPIEGPKVLLADLLKAVPAPERPLAAIHQEVILPPPPPGAPGTALPKPQEIIAAHGAAVFEFGKMLKGWDAAFQAKGGSLRAPLIVLKVEVQRQRRAPDGSWEPAETVPPAGPAPISPLPALPPYEPKTAEQRRLIFEALEKFAQAQQDILEPPWYTVLWPNRQWGTWQIHKPRTRVSDLLNVPEEAVPGVRPAFPPAEVPLLPPTPGPGARRRVPLEAPPMPGEDDLFVPGARRLDPGPGTPSLPGRTPYGRLPAPAPMPPPRLPAGELPAAEAEAGTPIVEVPRLVDQLTGEQGILEVWFHDAPVTEAVTYRYRLRLVVFNPLFGQHAIAENKADADVVTITTEWSPWSEGAAVKRPTEFFLVGHFPANQEVSVEVFTLKWGQRVFNRFTVRRGDPIGGEASMQLTSPGSAQLEPAVVNFKTGAIAVDFNFHKTVVIRGANLVRTDTEMLLLDETGELTTRLVSADDSSPRIKSLRAEVKQAAAAPAAGP